MEARGGHLVGLRMWELEKAGKATAWRQLKDAVEGNKIALDASPGACSTDGSFHLPKYSLEFLSMSPLWAGHRFVFSVTQFMVGQENGSLEPLVLYIH